MKRQCIAVFICLFWSVIMFAQKTIGEAVQISQPEDCNSVEIIIKTVIWNANYTRLEEEANNESSHFGDLPVSLISPDERRDQCHIVVLRFKKSDNFKPDDTFSFDTSVNVPANIDKRVYFLFADPKNSISVERGEDNNTIHFDIKGSIYKDDGVNNIRDGNITGVVTAVAVMGRSENPLLPYDCLVLELNDRTINDDCLLPNITSDVCTY